MSKWEEAGRETRCSNVVRDEVKNHSGLCGTLSRSQLPS